MSPEPKIMSSLLGRGLPERRVPLVGRDWDSGLFVSWFRRQIDVARLATCLKFLHCRLSFVVEDSTVNYGDDKDSTWSSYLRPSTRERQGVWC